MTVVVGKTYHLRHQHASGELYEYTACINGDVVIVGRHIYIVELVAAEQHPYYCSDQPPSYVLARESSPGEVPDITLRSSSDPEQVDMCFIGDLLPNIDSALAALIQEQPSLIV